MSNIDFLDWKFEEGQPGNKNLAWTSTEHSLHIEAKPPGGGSYKCFDLPKGKGIQLDKGGKRKVLFPKSDLTEMLYFEPGKTEEGTRFVAKDSSADWLEYQSVDGGSIFRFEYHNFLWWPGLIPPLFVYGCLLIYSLKSIYNDFQKLKAQQITQPKQKRNNYIWLAVWALFLGVFCWLCYWIHSTRNWGSNSDE